MFRSPTSTPQDEAAAKALATLAGEDIHTYAEQMFEAGADLTGRTAEDVFSSDFKAFSRGDVKFGVGQSTYMTDKSRAAAEALVEPYLPEASRREGLPLIFYMFTDMKTQSTDLMFMAATPRRSSAMRSMSSRRAAWRACPALSAAKSS